MGHQPELIKASFFPEDVRPFPKAGPRKVSNCGEKRRKITTLTDIPELRKEQENDGAEKNGLGK
jgi:hypothetical protein